MTINTQFEKHLDTVASEFVENSKKYQEIISFHHTDADGISCGSIIKSMLERMHLTFRQIPVNLKEAWDVYLDKIIPSLKGSTGIIFSDLCPSAKQILEFLAKTKLNEIEIYILDHHIFQQTPLEKLPETVYSCNPTQFGLNGLKEIVGSALNYLFARSVDEKNTQLGWIAAIGMGGDVLDHWDGYKSYNRQVIQEAADLGIIEIKSGLCAYGGMHETLSRGLALSILPFIPQIEGNPEIAEEMIYDISLDPKKKLHSCGTAEIALLSKTFGASLQGEYIHIPHKQGLFQFAFEHAQAISFTGYDKPLEAMQMIFSKGPTSQQKESYVSNMQMIVKNLTAFVQLPKIETKFAILVDTSGRIEPKAWSDTASFASINRIFNQQKILLIGGNDGDQMKFSVRCSSEFINAHNNHGANQLIASISQSLGGSGGGHPLAGGLRIKPELYANLPKMIDDLIQKL